MVRLITESSELPVDDNTRKEVRSDISYIVFLESFGLIDLIKKEEEIKNHLQTMKDDVTSLIEPTKD